MKLDGIKPRITTSSISTTNNKTFVKVGDVINLIVNVSESVKDKPAVRIGKQKL